MTEDVLKNKYKAYKEEEEILKINEESNYRCLVSILTKIGFILHFPILITGLVYLCIFLYNIIHVEFPVHALVGVIGGVVLLFYFITITMIWTDSDYNTKPGSLAIIDYFVNLRNRKLKIKEIKIHTKERLEFLKFYELYNSDSDFKEAYNLQMMPKNNAKEFLKRLSNE